MGLLSGNNNPGDDMRKGPSFIPVAVIVALAFVTPCVAASDRGGRVASVCSNVTVNGGKYVGQLTLRFVLIGRVSCSEARRLVRAYFRKMAAGQCGVQNNFCNLQFPGGWDCSIFFATESQETGGAVAGCARSEHEKIRLYKVTRSSDKPGTLHLGNFLSPDRKVWCDIRAFGASCGTYPEPPTRSGEVNAVGKATICTVLRLEYPNGAYVPAGCFQNWPTPEEKVPVLSFGQQTEGNGFRCTSATNGITCVTVAGTGAGKGFRINKNEAVQVG